MKSGFTVAWVTILLLVLELHTAIDGFSVEENTGSTCQRMTKDVAKLNRETNIIYPPPLSGKWISDRCETRVGPRHLIRSYTFYPNNTFYLLQFYYNDESCSSVAYTIAASGAYKLKPRTTPTTLSAKLSYDLHSVTVVAHDIQTANNLTNTINEVCPSLTVTYWKPFEEYEILMPKKYSSSADDETSKNNDYRITKSTRERQENLINSDSDISCLSAINLSFNELSVIRVQVRPTFDGSFRHELLLSVAYQYSLRPEMKTKYQLPLILINKSRNCLMCDTVSKSTNMFVHHLNAKPMWPLNITGEWISETCEPQSITGLFSTRNFKFDQHSFQWEMEKKFYSNYICSHLLLVQLSYGYYRPEMPSKKVVGATDVNFKIEQSFLTIAEESYLNTFLRDPLCGMQDYWKVGVPQRIPSIYGCLSFGIINPSIKHSIARLDMNDEGSYILYLGDEGINGDRPTTYQYPLLQCCDSSDCLQFSVDSSVPDSANFITLSNFIILVVPIIFRIIYL